MHYFTKTALSLSHLTNPFLDDVLSTATFSTKLFSACHFFLSQTIPLFHFFLSHSPIPLSTDMSLSLSSFVHLSLHCVFLNSSSLGLSQVIWIFLSPPLSDSLSGSEPKTTTVVPRASESEIEVVGIGLNQFFCFSFCVIFLD